VVPLGKTGKFTVYELMMPIDVVVRLAHVLNP